MHPYIFQSSITHYALRFTFHVSRFTYDKCPADVRFSDRAPQKPSIRRVFPSIYLVKCPVKKPGTFILINLGGGEKPVSVWVFNKARRFENLAWSLLFTDIKILYLEWRETVLA